MPQVINTNVSSLNSQRSLNTSQASLTTSLQRLSSGLRINSAKDDAAGLAISARMTSQINGLNQASRNANDGISLAQTAEGGLQSVTESLQRMRELAVQSSNASNTSTDRAAIQQEVDQLVQQINTVASQTAFNGVKLLDGSFNSQSFQIGANTGEKITISSIASAKADSLGVGTTSSYTTTLESAKVTNGAISTGGITVNGYGVGPSVTDGVSSSAQITGAAATASTSIDAAADTSVVGALPTAATNVGGAGAVVTGAAITGTTAVADGDLTINGVDVTGITASADVDTRGALMVTRINAINADTGVTAAYDTTSNKLTLTSTDGTDITIGGTAAAADTGLATSDSTLAGASGNFVKINGTMIGAVGGGSNATTQGTAMAAAINAKTGTTGVTATASATGVLTLSSAAGSAIKVELGGNGATGSGLTAGTTDANYIKVNGVTIGAITGVGTASGQAAAVATAINTAMTAAGKTDMVASSDTAGKVTLTSRNGGDVKVELSGTGAAASGLTAGTTKVGSDSAIAKAAAFNTVTGQTGVSAVATQASVTSGALSTTVKVAGDNSDYIKINGVKLGSIAAGSNTAEQGNNVVAAFNAVSNQTGVTASFDTSTNKLTLAAADGRTITVETKGSAAATNTGFAANTVTNTYGGIKLSSNSSTGINIGGANIASTALTTGYTAAAATFGAGIASIDLTTSSGAQIAIGTIDSALSNINSSRANLGAVQNRFSSVVSNLATTSENLSASRSRILDADFAAETASLSRNQILQQAGTAMLAQANSLPQNVLSLLRG